MELLLPLLIPMAWYAPFVSIGSAIMQPLYWVVSGILVLAHGLFAPVFGARQRLDLGLVHRHAHGGHPDRTDPAVRQADQVLALDAAAAAQGARAAEEVRSRPGEARSRDHEALRENNANPLASCLPLLLQMPIFLALFRVLDGVARTNASGSHRPRPLAEGEPGAGDSLNQATIFGARISDTFLKVLRRGHHQRARGDRGAIVAMTVTLFITQLQLMRKNMPPEALTGPFAQQQKIMLYAFPLIFAVGGINFPVGVLIYWFTSNLWTMGQQFYVIRRNPAPGTPAYEAGRSGARPTERQGGGEEPDGGEEPERGQGATPLAPVPNGGGAAAAAAPPRVVRQQPRKQTRSQRKR